MMKIIKQSWWLALALVGWISFNAIAVSTMTIQIKTAQVRSEPSFLSRMVANLSYGESVHVLEERGAWVKIGLTGVQGWLHRSAVTSDKIALKAGASDVGKGASATEVALAAKGFSEQVEREFRTKNPEMNYKRIDQMEKSYIMPDAEISRFVKDGGLSLQGGF